MPRILSLEISGWPRPFKLTLKNSYEFYSITWNLLATSPEFCRWKLAVVRTTRCLNREWKRVRADMSRHDVCVDICIIMRVDKARSRGAVSVSGVVSISEAIRRAYGNFWHSVRCHGSTSWLSAPRSSVVEADTVARAVSIAAFLRQRRCLPDFPNSTSHSVGTKYN